jgi:predicted metal-dependent hydrolase
MARELCQFEKTDFEWHNRGKMKLEFEGLCFEVRFRPVKYSRIEFKSPIPVVTVPKGTDPLDILRQKKETILKKHAKMMEHLAHARQLPFARRSEADFKFMVDHLLRKYAKQLKVKYKEVKFRKMKRRWGSCRSDGIITLNRCLQLLPERLISYIVFHELVHLLVPGHNIKFKTILFAKFPDYRVLEAELKLYGYRLLL